MNKKLVAILLIDDDEEDYIITRDLIETIDHQKYTLDWVPNYERGLEIIRQKAHHIYLVDYMLGPKSGLEIIQEALALGCEAPLILLTGAEMFEVDNQALIAGAADFIVKSHLTATHLERSIRYSLRHADNVKKIRSLNQDLEKRVIARTEALAMAIRQLEHTNKELENEIKERKLAEEALQKSRIELITALEKEKQLNELKSRFVSMASHEFRTPLSTVLSSLSLLEKYDIPEYQDRKKKHFQRIKSSIHYLTALLNDFLSVEKLEEGKIQSHPTCFSLYELLSKISEDLENELKTGQTIALSFEANKVKTVSQDAQLLTYILLNLLSNAIKYSPENSSIFLTASYNEQDIAIHVRDQGIGIPINEQEHLFQRFFRAHNATNIPGTGLGLSIVKKYVELMEGKLSFVSKEFEGSTFTVVLPNLRANEEDSIDRG